MSMNMNAEHAATDAHASAPPTPREPQPPAASLTGPGLDNIRVQLAKFLNAVTALRGGAESLSCLIAADQATAPRKGDGTLSPHWRIGTSGSTSSAHCLRPGSVSTRSISAPPDAHSGLRVAELDLCAGAGRQA
jgi:hypothetical protein